MAEASAPLIWLLLGAKAGDNAQVRRLGALLPGRRRELQLSFNGLHALPNSLLGASLATLQRGARAQLAPPWPDLVISAGKRSAPVARWIRQQSGGKSRLVHIGRPRAPLGAFDLVITTPQYRLPPAENVMVLPLPLSGWALPDAEALDRWHAAWSSLPRPLLAVAIGGEKFPLRFGAAEQQALAEALNRTLAEGGSAVLLGAPRTPEGALDRIAAALSVPHLAYPFSRDRNPYGPALALADRIAVTGDSASMLADALRARKPVSVFRLPVSPWRVSWAAQKGLGRILSQAGFLQPPRAMDHLVASLLAANMAGELGRSEGKGFAADYEEAAAARVRQLLTVR
jgi:mitochondrial fission protein ELM1